ncbi:hypothetical protein HIM_08864 [Hirsutella minnesotensis 3608]|uniref:AA1-like domain-containing protein n=1 Tax=Hirsutella minnesotensis 3608 TaxID=1043627 RepID=A0A0F7ZY23_9HYPO|nr:hypothetical protein HIM_11699 [Hirsutella minnesotensis 3608]KJZ71722.1 hypothetical protein HIM_08864 [Hirsutella minnesotensis 3608]
MRSIATACSFLAALAAAAPAGEEKPHENIEIQDFTVRKDVSNGTKINVVDFNLSGRDAKALGCTAQNPTFPKPSEVVTCGDSKYRFSLHAGSDNNEFSLRIYHELSVAFGYWGQQDVPTYCHAGGNGQDFVCSQVPPTIIVIDNTPPPVEP